jgi:hypothetical protein
MRRPNRVPFDRYPLATVLGAVAVAGVLAAIVVVGPGGVFHFLFSFQLPMAVVLRFWWVVLSTDSRSGV